MLYLSVAKNLPSQICACKYYLFTWILELSRQPTTKTHRFLTHYLQSRAVLQSLLPHKIILRNNSSLLGKFSLASGNCKPFMNSYIALPSVTLVVFYFIYKQKYLSQQLYDEHTHLYVPASPVAEEK